MTYRFVILRRAERDFHKIVQWLTKRSPVGAENWRFAFTERLAEIVKDPFRHSKVAEAAMLPFGVREALFSTPLGNTYRVVFLVEQTEVRVLRIRGPGQLLCGRVT
jgi:plasmid stabilization system protein ParE